MIAAIAEIELPMGQWPELIRLLLDNVTSTDNADLKTSTLEAIGYVCEATVSGSSDMAMVFMIINMRFRTPLFSRLNQMKF